MPQLIIRLDDDLYDHLIAAAEHERRSLNNQVIWLLQQGLYVQPARREARATRIPEDFSVTAEDVAWARREVPGVDGRAETEKFRDYWLAESGARARKVDWHRAWKVWMRKADTRTGQRRSTTHERVQQGLDLAARYAAEEQQQAITQRRAVTR